MLTVGLAAVGGACRLAARTHGVSRVKRWCLCSWWIWRRTARSHVNHLEAHAQHHGGARGEQAAPMHDGVTEAAQGRRHGDGYHGGVGSAGCRSEEQHTGLGEACHPQQRTGAGGGAA